MPDGTPIEVWFQDEARLGQKNGQTRIWAKKGTRPRLPADQRYKNAYLFGAICPAHGKGAALMLPYANTEAMQMHLDEISKYVARKSHAVILMDRANGSGRVAYNRKTRCSQKHHHHPVAITLTGTKPGGKHLAIPAPELALKQGV